MEIWLRKPEHAVVEAWLYNLCSMPPRQGWAVGMQSSAYRDAVGFSKTTTPGIASEEDGALTSRIRPRWQRRWWVLDHEGFRTAAQPGPITPDDSMQQQEQQRYPAIWPLYTAVHAPPACRASQGERHEFGFGLPLTLTTLGSPDERSSCETVLLRYPGEPAGWTWWTFWTPSCAWTPACRRVTPSGSRCTASPRASSSSQVELCAVLHFAHAPPISLHSPLVLRISSGQQLNATLHCRHCQPGWQYASHVVWLGGCRSKGGCRGVGGWAADDGAHCSRAAAPCAGLCSGSWVT